MKRWAAVTLAVVLVSCVLPDFGKSSDKSAGNNSGGGKSGGNGGSAASGEGGSAASSDGGSATGGTQAGKGANGGDGAAAGNGGAGSSGASGAAAGSGGTTPNNPPEAVADAYVMAQGEPQLSGSSVLDNDTDPDRDPLRVDPGANRTSDERGTYDIASNGTFSYRPPTPFWGRDGFNYTTRDTHGDGAEGLVTITVEPGEIPLDALSAGFGGFVINGIEGHAAGWAVAALGDINGDERSDLAIGVPERDGGGGVYIVYGKDSTNAVNLADIETKRQGGFAILGITNESLGSALGVADVNGDGKPDLLIGAPDNTNDAGRVYVVFGSDERDVSWDLTNVTAGDGGFIIDGANALDRAGASVAGLGDLDGDGLDEIVVGAPGAGADAGQAYVLWGRDKNTSPVFLREFSPWDGFTLRGAAESRAGEAVAGLGDFNGDNTQDILIGAPGINDGPRAVYVVFGKTRDYSSDVNLAELDAEARGFVLHGTRPFDELGRSVSGCGDIDADGHADFIAGASGSGVSYVVFSNSSSLSAETHELYDERGGGFAIDGEFPNDGGGRAVSGVGDVDGDGVPDLLLGAPFADKNGTESDSGSAFLIYGTARPQRLHAGGACSSGDCGFALRGEHKADQAGFAASAAGDVNDDGYADFVVGAPYAAPMGGASGRVYVVFGGPFRGAREDGYLRRR